MHLVVVGGGAAGSLLALLALRRMPRTLVTLVDRNAAFGRGIAYAVGEPCHRINVPSPKMGGIELADDDGFVRWLGENDRAAATFSASFVPRSWFGDYLVFMLTKAVETGRLRLFPGEVTALQRQPDGRWRCCGSDWSLLADQVALCPGNPQPARPAGHAQSVRFIPDVWAPQALGQIAADDPVLLLGTGATAVDAVLALVAGGHRAKLTMLSRRGLLPLVDVPPLHHADFFDPAEASRGLRTVMRRLRQEVARAATRNVPWQVVVDAFRVHAAQIWQCLDQSDQRRFLRHLRAIWMVHRHRLAPDIALQLDGMRAAGRLAVVAGRLVDRPLDHPLDPPLDHPLHPPLDHPLHPPLDRPFDQPLDRPFDLDAGPEACSVEYRPRGLQAIRTLQARWILNCIGPAEDFSRLDDPLWVDLFGTGTVRAGPLGLGLDVDSELRLIDTEGRPHANLYAIGLPTRGRFWEVTAVIHIRRQAEALAAYLHQQCP